MARTENPEVLQRVREAYARWLPLLGLENWTVIIREWKKPDKTCGMSTIVQDTYRRRAWVDVNTRQEEAALLMDQDFQRHIVHEIMHLVLSEIRRTAARNMGDPPFAEEYHPAEETTADDLAAIIIRLVGNA